MPSLAESLEPPPRLARRRADRAGGQVTRDRLATMIMLAALLHGIVILGVSFAPPGEPERAVDPGIEVLLVSDELPEERQNEDATYLAQRTQSGSGNSTERRAAEVPDAGRSAPPPPPPATGETGEDPALAATALQGAARIVALPLAAPAPAVPPAAAPAPESAGDDELRLRGAARDELYVTPDTRASRLAPYLDAWRRRVERVGTVNYPSVAQRRGLAGNPVVEVALHRDGRLQQARIVRTSGHPEIDAAALDILRLASPFDPFPPELARDYRLLRFAYEWQFVGGRVTETAVSVP